MSVHREYLAASLRRVIDGGDITNAELSAGIPDARVLKGDELKAYLGLSYWTDDADIRQKDPLYGPARRTALIELLKRLNP
ncbi:hypothetical protein [Brevundimonas sp.]